MSGQNDTYAELWNPKVLETRRCSRLFSLEPIGIGTSVTESLSSYLCRLADEHCVSLQRLVTQEISPLMIDRQNEQNSGSRSISSIFGNSDAKPAINGMRDKTRSLINVLEQLTLRQNLRYLSCWTYQGIIRDRSLFRSSKAWCPHCFEQWRRENKPIYEPLIWSFKDITHCPVHSCQLIEKCSNCNSPQKAIAKYSRLGYCSLQSKKLGKVCQQWLGSQNFDSGDNIEYEERKIVEGIGELIAIAPILSASLTREELLKKLRLIQFWFEREIEQDLKLLVTLGVVLEKLKIALGRNSNKPLDIVNLLIPVCDLAKITISQFIRDDISILARTLNINLMA